MEYRRLALTTSVLLSSIVDAGPDSSQANARICGDTLQHKIEKQILKECCKFGAFFDGPATHHKVPTTAFVKYNQDTDEFEVIEYPSCFR